MDIEKSSLLLNFIALFKSWAICLSQIMSPVAMGEASGVFKKKQKCLKKKDKTKKE